MKLDELMADITKKYVFVVVAAYVYVIESQKRGLRRAHILIILAEESKLREVADINATVCAEIPDQDNHPQTF